MAKHIQHLEPCNLRRYWASARWLRGAEHGVPLRPEQVISVLAQARLDVRRDLVLRALERDGCDFRGEVGPEHRPLSWELDKVAR